MKKPPVGGFLCVSANSRSSASALYSCGSCGCSPSVAVAGRRYMHFESEHYLLPCHAVAVPVTYIQKPRRRYLKRCNQVKVDLLWLAINTVLLSGKRTAMGLAWFTAGLL
jgi:hypothetical protein